MTNQDRSDTELLKAITALAKVATKANIGDVLVGAVSIAGKINGDDARRSAEAQLSRLRQLAYGVDAGWSGFSNPPQPSHQLSNREAAQLLAIEGALHAFCYGAERLEEAAQATGPLSTPVRFYINSLYHYMAALFLLDKGKLPMGGNVYKALSPMGLTDLLNPVQRVLNEPLHEENSFGETVLRIRNKFIVHGDFVPTVLVDIMKESQLYDVNQQRRLSRLIWDLFHETFILDLKIIAIMSNSHFKLNEVVADLLDE